MYGIFLLAIGALATLVLMERKKKKKTKSHQLSPDASALHFLSPHHVLSQLISKCKAAR